MREEWGIKAKRTGTGTGENGGFLMRWLLGDVKINNSTFRVR